MRKGVRGEVGTKEHVPRYRYRLLRKKGLVIVPRKRRKCTSRSVAGLPMFKIIEEMLLVFHYRMQEG